MRWARTAVVFVMCAASALPQAEWRRSPGYRAYQKGDALFVAKKFPEAMAAIEEALRLDPKLAPALTLKAKLAMAGDRFDMARESLDQALAADPKSAYAAFLYGLIFYVANDVRAAWPHFEKARQLNPADPRVALYLGLSSESLGQTGKALAHYEEAVRLERRAGRPQAETFLTGARLLLIEGREDDGARWIAQALKAEPDSRDAHFEWARLLLAKGKAAEAGREGETALRLHRGDTTDAQIHYLLLRAYRRSGNPALAGKHADILRLLDGKPPG